ncbi:MAG: hypothetical protein ACLT8E_05755 [Akkermansia sp.]
MQATSMELPDVSLYYYRFAVKNICAVNSANARFASMKTSKGL